MRILASPLTSTLRFAWNVARLVETGCFCHNKPLKIINYCKHLEILEKYTQDLPNLILFQRLID